MADVLTDDALAAALQRLDGWSGSAVTEPIAKDYRFADFAGAMAFVNRVADVAEEMNHHPDIHVSWNTVRLEIISHSAGGVTGDCVRLAERADAAAQAG